MPSFSIVRESNIIKTARVLQLEGIFDVSPSEKSVVSWDIDFNLPETWNVGLIVGPSGSGKSTFAREVFSENMAPEWEWSHDHCILDDFDASMSIKEITTLLSMVGFSSPPSWLRPYHVLSTGEKFRVDIARTLSEMKTIAVVDEFTSVIDRTVARIGSAAIQKCVRKRNQQFIAVSCHYDILEWLEPDWVFEPHTGTLRVGRSERRPKINLEIKRVHHSAWQMFSKYHYLNHKCSTVARFFCAFYEGIPVALTSAINTPHTTPNLYREHRTVCLPDYQGVGIGSVLSETIASAYSAIGKRYSSRTSSPSFNISRRKNANWICLDSAKMSAKTSAASTLKTLIKTSHGRITSGWQYVGAKMDVKLARDLIYGYPSEE